MVTSDDSAHESMASRHVLAGLFVGGRGARMGGIDKGLLVAPDAQLIATRWARLFDAVGLRAVRVGRAEACARYADVLPGLDVVVDDPPGIGPLGGLAALLAHAAFRGVPHVVTVACDMPRVSRPLLERLVSTPCDAAVLAPRIDGHWQPFFARWAVARAFPRARDAVAAGRRSMMAALDAAGCGELEVDALERAELVDWDTPEDVQRGR